MKRFLITGWRGFFGSNLLSHLKNNKDVRLFKYGSNSNKKHLVNVLSKCDLIFHLAGINRNDTDSKFYEVNTELTRNICSHLIEINRSPKIIFTSSIQVENTSVYGKSKLLAEDILKEYQQNTGSQVTIYRLPGVFGKWSKPNYNTVVSTFCNNIARGIPIKITDNKKKIMLVYIDDVINEFINEINSNNKTNKVFYKKVNPMYKLTLGKLARTIISFKESRNTLKLPDFKDLLTKKLHATFLSFMPTEEFAYQLPKMKDDRGVLAEFIISKSLGQIFVSSTGPGKIRGNHYHHTKVEKFLILSGKGIIRFKSIIYNGEIISYEVDGKELKVVDIPPGYTHSIENISNDEMIVLFWASEIYDSNTPDTDYFPVQ